MNTHKKHVGNTCAAARKGKGWTLNRTATESGLKAHQIEGIEDGSKAYTFNSLVQLCSVLGLTIEVGMEGGARIPGGKVLSVELDEAKS